MMKVKVNEGQFELLETVVDLVDAVKLVNGSRLEIEMTSYFF